ncbi:unnamed protein product, partial [Symbiodinium necroappetens]
MTYPSCGDRLPPLRREGPALTEGARSSHASHGFTDKATAPGTPVVCAELPSHEDNWLLITLLEESVASPVSEAFFLAATLLETLLEHFAVEEVPPAPRELTASRIDLFPLLPPPAFGLDADSVLLPHSRCILRQLFSAWPPTWLFPDDWSDALLPPSTLQCLGSLLPRAEVFQSKRLANLSFSLYTDGSATPARGTSGYAVVILGHAGSETALLGSLGDQIAGNQASPWVPDGPLALHAEHIAIAVALLWTMQMRGVIEVVQCSLYFDCTAAGWSATGQWQTSGPASEFVHHLYMTAKAMPGITVEFAHVRGHSGDPWNDLADHIAKTAAGQQTVWPRPPEELCRAVAAQDISWLAPEMDARVHHAAPIFDGIVHWSDTCFARAPLQPQQLVPITNEGGCADNELKDFSLLAATINIQSLRNKCKYVEEQLVARGIQLVFLQETKLPGGTVTSEHYLRLHTGAESHWGVGIWIHRKLGVLRLGKEALHVDESDVATLHETPRLLVVLLTIGDLRIGLLSGHCPHASRPQERIDFLNTLAPLLQRLKQTNLLVGGIDLNGRVPPDYTGVSGSLEFGEPDDTGWSFAPILADAGVWIPSMYTQLHCGDSTTYVHPNGQQHRIDYILLGGKALVDCVRSEVDETFDNGSPQEDHLLLQLSITGNIALARRPSRLLRPTYDREKILSEEGRVRIRRTLAVFQHPAWDVHPDQHCLQMEEFLRNELDTHFAKPPVQRRASYIPDTVWISNAEPFISGEQDKAMMSNCIAKAKNTFLYQAAFRCYDDNVVWSAEMLPNYTDIEKVLRGIRRNKAAGLDNIPGEMLKAAPAAYHRTVRDKTQALCRDELHPLHLGSKKHARRFGLDEEDINELMSTVKEFALAEDLSFKVSL